MKTLKTRGQRKVEELNSLIDELDIKSEKILFTKDLNLDDYKEIQIKIQDLKEQKRILKLEDKIKRVNAYHKEQRDIIKELLKIGLPAEDITNNDCSFHATKIKKYPELLKLVESHNIKLYYSYKAEKYTHFTYYKNHKTTSIDLLIHGNYTEAGHDYLDFNGIIERNDIRLKNVTLKAFLKTEKKLIILSKKIREDLKEYETKIDSLDSHRLHQEGLIVRNSKHEYCPDIIKITF